MNRSFTKKDFIVEWFSGQGAGGQHRNKHQNCCRIRHIDSDLVGVGQTSRSRVENQRIAFNTLARKLIAYYYNDDDDDGVSANRAKNNVVRTYHFCRNVATDGTISLPIQSVMDGNLDELMKNALNNNRVEKSTGRM